MTTWRQKGNTATRLTHGHRKLRLAEDFKMLRLTPDFDMLCLTCDFKTLRLTPARRSISNIASHVWFWNVARLTRDFKTLPLTPARCNVSKSDDCVWQKIQNLLSILIERVNFYWQWSLMIGKAWTKPYFLAHLEKNRNLFLLYTSDSICKGSWAPPVVKVWFNPEYEIMALVYGQQSWFSLKYTGRFIGFSARFA